MITGAPKYVMISFFAVGALLAGFSLWALNTEIPLEQFEADPRFEEEYLKYYQWLLIFGIALLVLGGITGFWGRNMAIRKKT